MEIRKIEICYYSGKGKLSLWECSHAVEFLSAPKDTDSLQSFCEKKIMKLDQQVAKTEAAAWKETQPKKRFDLYTRLQKYKQELEDLKRG